MFFFLSKTLGQLIYPLPIFFLFFLIFFIVYRKKIKYKAAIAVPVLILYLLSTSLIANFLIGVVEPPRVKLEQLDSNYDAVVVLGGMVDLEATKPGMTEYRDSTDRIIAGVQVLRENKADKLIISGGSGNLFDQSKSEAVLLETYAKNAGINKTDIILEPGSRNTYENAREVKKITKEKGIKKLLLITSAFHMRRSKACFNKQGLYPDTYPVDYRSKKITPFFNLLPSAYNLYKVRIVLKESVGMVAYKIRGYI